MTTWNDQCQPSYSNAFGRRGAGWCEAHNLTVSRINEAMMVNACSRKFLAGSCNGADRQLFFLP